MKSLLRLFPCLLLISLFVPASAAPADPFAGYSGTVIVLDLQTNRYQGLNETFWDVGSLPASTFKVPHSLIGLESGVIADVDFVIPWDGVTRDIKAWNQDHSLKTAFAASSVPYYQALARRVGFGRMAPLVESLGYGTMDVRAGNLDEFWLRGHSRISPRQQADFLARLVRRQLPVSQRSQDLVESIMLRSETPAYRYYGKTGWVFEGGHETGWFVGFVRRGDKAWTFASRIEADKPDAARFGPAREAAARAYLKQMGIID